MSNLKKPLDHSGSYGILTSLTPAESNPGDLEPRRSLDNPLTQTGQPGPALLVPVLTNTVVLGDVLLLAALAAAASKVVSRPRGEQERQKANLGPQDSTLAYSGISYRILCVAALKARVWEGRQVFKDKLLQTQQWSCILRESRGKRENVGSKKSDLAKWGTHAWEPMKKGHKKELEPKTYLKNTDLGMQGCCQESALRAATSRGQQKLPLLL